MKKIIFFIFLFFLIPSAYATEQIIFYSSNFERNNIINEQERNDYRLIHDDYIDASGNPTKNNGRLIFTNDVEIISPDDSFFINLDDIEDVVINSLSQFNILFYNGVSWVNQIFKINTITCSDGQFFNSLSNQTGILGCATPNSSGSGIPLPPKRWGTLIPVSASTALEGLMTGCTISATASYAYNAIDKASVIVSTTAVTDGVNGGISCVATDHHVYRGDQNAYMYSAWSENKITTNRIFIGFTSSATILPNNADTILNAISGAGLCIRTTDTVYQFCSNDGTGAMEVASLTTTENVNYHYFEVYTTDAGVTWCGKLDGGTAVCTSTVANIPAPTTRLYAMSSGETDGGATAIIWRQFLMYTQNDK